MAGIGARLARLDWPAIEATIDERGYARTPAVLTGAECAALAALFDRNDRFRSRVRMQQYRFGVGDYAYFDRPLPRLVGALRTHAYRYLAPIANRWATTLGEALRFPATLAEFSTLCAARGQTRPTPLLLRYTAGGYNGLHKDLYGDVAFPLQITCVLSRRDVDYDGGEFVLVEQRPREQLRAEIVVSAPGELVIFPTAHRPVAGRRGPLRVAVRHGASRVHRGVRYALGVIFHDAR